MNARKVVWSVEDEDRAIGGCACGGSWRLAGETVDAVCGRWVDSLTVTCGICSVRRTFEFDITPFFEVRPSVWSRRSQSPQVLTDSLLASAA